MVKTAYTLTVAALALVAPELLIGAAVAVATYRLGGR